MMMEVSDGVYGYDGKSIVQWMMTRGLQQPNQSDHCFVLVGSTKPRHRRQRKAYLISSRVFSMASWSSRSSLRMEGGVAREKPVPTTVHPALSKARMT